MSFCINGGTCNQWGQCVCHSGYKGADCQYKALTESTQWNAEGSAWGYFQAGQGESVAISNADKSSMTLYVKEGESSSPNQFDYDLMIKEVKPTKSVTIDDNVIATDKGFTVAVHVHGWDAAKNASSTNHVSFLKSKKQPENFSISFFDSPVLYILNQFNAYF